MAGKKINIKKNNIAHFDEKAVSKICWGMLFHMLGLSEDKKRILKEMNLRKNYCPPNDTIKEIAELLNRYEYAKKLTERSAIHKSLVKKLVNLFDPEKNGIDAPKLGKECPRSDDYRKANDSPSSGYSRDPFKEIRKEHKPEIALATIAYLVRAHAYFFCRPRIERDFNAAKVSLNDIFQATQLGCRLYYALPESHLKKYSQRDYLDKVKTEPRFNDPPWVSPFFIWWVLELVEIWRGNIYRQIGYIDESERYYRHAQERFDRLSNDSLDLSIPHITIKAGTNTESPDKYYITPTIILALFERSKILFDRGHFIESIMNQLRCLAYLIRIPAITGKSDSYDTLMDLTHTLRFLDVVRKQSVWDKEKITRFFGHPKNASIKKIGKLTAPIGPKRFIDSLETLCHSDRDLAAEIFARLAFTLFLLRRSQMPFSRKPIIPKDEYDDIANWLRPYLEIYKELKLEKHPSLAWYTETYLVDKKRSKHIAKKDEVVFEEHIERQFAYRLRENVASNSYIIAPLEEQSFYRAVLDSVTQNIGNIVTIPRQLYGLFMRHGYKHRRAFGDLSHKTLYESLENKESSSMKTNINNIQNKLVVLRRWQSYNPEIPRPLGANVRGGGYFLLWKGKGIVIDPGYDFIQNFYDEGFSLEDIDAIIVTHSHPDHDDDLSSLITLIKEWNGYHKQMGYPEARLINIDLFLNESAHLKFSDWLKSSKVGIGRVIGLPLVVWNNDSQKSSEHIRGENVTLKLRNEYYFDLEVIPAWHDDVIGKTAAVGLKFHLFDPDISENEVGTVGYTGDTGAYGVTTEKSKDSKLLIQNQYNDCNVLIAHLGDVKLRELSTVSKADIGNCINKLLFDWFYDPNEKRVTKKMVTKQKVESFLNLLIVLDIAPSEALEAVIEEHEDRKIAVSNALYNFIQTNSTNLKDNFSYGLIQDKLKSLLPQNYPVHIEKEFINHMTKVVYATTKRKSRLQEWQKAYILLGFLCAFSLMPWYYPYHLGILGLFKLHKVLSENKMKLRNNRIFIVGEFPEELASYRHHIARLLNATQSTMDRGRTFSFTGDIGLHISLSIGENKVLDPKIRCNYCNYNNESVLNETHPHYHRPDNILETALKRLESSIIYLCTEHDHHPELQDKPFDFLSSPNISVI